ncbi:Gfo/Idh/MocA family protein [Bacillus cereus]|uniref:Gfo/Idh/MocA family protein n=1 Tax=Bacillus cereus TaxID=1396 RepID=UPI00065B6D7A|nr:Gfo/Idh/MocA family oxidoreductase [Bacillus cereus]KMQ32158.1 hypothetical protein TU58_01340 [Bacillus cereus]
MDLSVGVVGLGWLSETVHLPYLIKSSKIKSIFCYEPNVARVTKIKKKFNYSKKIIFVGSFEELLNIDEADAIMIITPNFLHYYQIEQTLKAGKIALVEKPICISSNEIQGLYELSDIYKGKIIPLLPNRFRKDIQYIKENLDQLGSIYKINMRWSRRNGIPTSNWFLEKEKAGGGVLIDLGSHILDILLYLLDFNMPVTTQGVLTNHFLKNNNKYADWHRGENITSAGNVEDSVTIFMKYPEMSSYVELSWASYEEFDETSIELYGNKGMLKLETILGFSQNVKNKEESIVEVNLGREISSYIAFDITNRTTPYFEMLTKTFDNLSDIELNYENFTNSLKSIEIICDIYSDEKNNIL